MKNKVLMIVMTVMFILPTFAQKTYPGRAPMTHEMTEYWLPQPSIVTPGQAPEMFISAPSDAIVLFDGKDLTKWENSKGEPAEWTVHDGVFTVKKGTGDIRTKQKFNDFQLHLEWCIPVGITGESQLRGNSGVFLQGMYEVQILDNYQNELSEKFPQFADTIIKVNLSSERIINEVIGFLNNWMNNPDSSAMARLSGTLGNVLNLFIGLIFAIYVLAQKEKLKRQTKNLLQAYLKQPVSETVWKVGKLTSITFQKFISGQCLEACILGTMFFITMTIFKIPYALLISVLIAVTSLIPIWGAFIGCIIGCFLIAVVNPMRALGFLIMFLILQQIEGNLIYPHVVGGSIGLPSIWVLAAVTVGGKLYGIVGMIFFIPICSVLYTLLKENVRYRLRKKKNLAVVKEEEINA